MPVYRYRSVEEIPPPWRDPGDPRNLHVVAEMLAFYRRAASETPRPGVRRYRSVAAANAERADPFRGLAPGS